MPLTITEAANSRTLTESRHDGRVELLLERIYIITGSDDPASADVLNLGPQPDDPYGDGGLDLYVASRKFEVLKAEGGKGAIRLTVTYGPPERLPGDPEISLGVSSQNQHIERAKSQTSWMLPSQVDTVGFLIGVNGDKIDGVDIKVPFGSYVEKREYETLAPEYYKFLLATAGKINSNPWKLWEAGEVLFEGADVSRKGKGLWAVTYNFSISPQSVETIEAENGIVGPFTKRGWDYMWFQRSKKSNDAQTLVEHKVEMVHVARVYDEADFNAFGLGE
jgi:hypothetical protein